MRIAGIDGALQTHCSHIGEWGEERKERVLEYGVKGACGIQNWTGQYTCGLEP